MDFSRIFVGIKNLLKVLKIDGQFTAILAAIAVFIACMNILYKLRKDIFTKNKEKVEINDDISVIFKDMLKEMNKRFLNYHMAPIVININPSKTMPSIGSDVVRFSIGENVHWMVNDRMAIVSIFRNHEYVMRKLQDMTNGFGFQCIVFNLDYNKIVDTYKVDCLNILNQYRSMIQKFGINAKCFVLTHVDGVFGDKRDVIGVEDAENSSLIDAFANSSMSNNSSIDMNVFASINNLSNISEYFFEMFRHYDLTLGGVFVCSSVSNEYTLIENFMLFSCYNACSDVKVSFRYYSITNRIFSIIRNVLFGFAFALVPLMLTKVYLSYGDMPRTERVLHDMYNEKPVSSSDIEHVRLQSDIDAVSYGIMNLLFQNGSIIHKTDRLISDYNLKMLDNRTHEAQNKEVFDRSPVDTIGYGVTLQDLAWIDRNISINQDNQVMIFSKVDTICDRFFENYYNTSLLLKVDKCIKILEDIEVSAISSDKLDLVHSLKRSLIDIDKYFVNNLWWISNDYELKFKSDVESMLSNSHLKQRIIERHRDFLDEFRVNIANYQHRLFGKIFDEKFQMSSDFKDFRDTCYDIFDDVIFSVSFSDIKVPRVRDTFAYFDVRALKKNIDMSNAVSKLNRIKDDRQRSVFTKIVGAQSDVYNAYLALTNMHFNDSLSVFDKINNVVEFCELSRSIGMNEMYISDVLTSSLNILCQDIFAFVDNEFIKLNAYEMKSVVAGNVGDLFAKYSHMISRFSELSKSIGRVVVYLEEYNIGETSKVITLKESIDSKNGPMINLFDFINSINKLDAKYQNKYKLLGSDLLNMKTTNFINDVIDYYNLSLNSVNVKEYQKIVNLFNNGIKDYLVNFNKSKLDYSSVVNNIQKLVIQFNSVKDNLYNDRYFTENKNLMDSLNNLRSFVDMFVVEDDKLFMRIKMDCHFTDDVITDDKFMPPLIHSYSIVTVDNKYKDTLNNGMIDCVVNCNDSFEFHIAFAENLKCLLSDTVFANFSKYADNNVYKFSFNKPLNFLDFVHNRLTSKVVDRKVVREMRFTVKNEYGKEKIIKTGVILDGFKSINFDLYSFE